MESRSQPKPFANGSVQVFQSQLSKRSRLAPVEVQDCFLRTGLPPSPRSFQGRHLEAVKILPGAARHRGITVVLSESDDAETSPHVGVDRRWPSPDEAVLERRSIASGD